jgi:Calcineurin-like phosphoesterase
MCVVLALSGAVAIAQQAPPAVVPSLSVAVRPIAAPATPLPDETASESVTRFSFIAYGDTRSGSEPGVPGDGQVLHPLHSRLVDGMLAKARELASTPHPVRFVVQSGDAVLRGQNAVMWNVSFTPIIDRLTRDGSLPYFFAAGNHDVTTMSAGDPGRSIGLHNTLTAMSNLIPREGSPRRLNGYPTYAFGYGNVFVVAIDSNIASDPVQLAWVGDQLDHLDRARYAHVVAVFHHPLVSSGPHGGDKIEPTTQAMRNLYAPLFRRHHVRLVICGHEHLLDHWVERYTDADGRASYRMDEIVSGGGGAPIYLYSGEPNLTEYLAAGAAQNLRVEHLTKPSATRDGNPHHFVVIEVDGDRLSLEVVAIDGAPYAPYAGRSRIELTDGELTPPLG